MKTSLTQRLFITLLLLLAVYTGIIVAVQQKIERENRNENLQSELDAYAEVVNNAHSKGATADLLPLLPEGLRVTIIADEGKVLLDTYVQNVGNMENHDTRPELQEARFHERGTAIRLSASTGIQTYYFARYYGNHYIRISLPLDYVRSSYDIQATDYFIYVSIAIFLTMAILLFIVARKYESSLKHLSQIGDEIAQGTPLNELDLPDGNLGAISKQLIALFEQKEEAIKEIEETRKRLILHFKLANTGIALFSKEGEAEFTNSHFIQYANMLATRPMTDASEIINEPQLASIKQFLEEKNGSERSFVHTVSQSNKIFEIKALKSPDGSYEMTVEDVTEEEKNRILKQEMTSNISHEIRTPLTSIRGYLETLNFMDLSEERRKEFTEKAYLQTVRVSEMMDDIRLLSKLDENTKASFDFSPVNLSQIAEEIRIAYTARFNEKGIKFRNELPPHLTIEGSQSLLYSILQNLVENSLRYAGTDIEIGIKCYHEDENFAYFSYYDTGKGVEEKHLGRLFERFYRVDDGRTRLTGGTGLGLSIVKNVLQLHGGQVQARRHISGGLEILFNLHK